MNHRLIFFYMGWTETADLSGRFARFRRIAQFMGLRVSLGGSMIQRGACGDVSSQLSVWIMVAWNVIYAASRSKLSINVSIPSCILDFVVVFQVRSPNLISPAYIVSPRSSGRGHTLLYCVEKATIVVGKSRSVNRRGIAKVVRSKGLLQP